MLDEQQQDTEFTLGPGKLLGLFFLLVLLCGVFFGLGYTVGHASQKTEGSLIAADKASAATPTPVSASNGSVRPLTSADKPQTDMGFYKAVEQKDPDSKLETPPPATPADDSKQSAPELQVSPGGAYVVQVAAVTKKEDAEVLQQALIKKQYPVVVTPGGGDKLFHVQIGPFAELKDAESMKGRLANDGYNAIVKK
jgi:cell division septation protein DedD